MMNYANRFSCFINGDKTEFVLMFAQDHPAINVKGEIEHVEPENIASVVMTAELAKNLKDQLEKLLSADTDQ